MKVSGTAVLHAPRERVWQALTDPAVLVRTIPGCERLEERGGDTYTMTVTAGVGSVKGTYAGEVQLRDQQEPDSFVLAASGAGAPGTVSADVAVTLSSDGDGATQLTYDADAIVGGMIGGVGQRMLTGVAKKTAGEFFAAVDDVLTGREPAAAAGVPGAPAAGVEAPPGAPTVHEAPVPVRSAAGAVNRDVIGGALAGAAIALAGVLVGGWVAGRRSR
ncbi:hypothetical protein CLV30_1063 [Haloactinopolyspora alba]|uniref:Carbon monoxide dehydrogenase subunit G n=1 Tax=Haloactinopolyspora alba TaxID=648780 RepID=A0A2P8E3F4_9ACTN|nr:carbon monoxide dehydrogenase subunit G [Haloactinopolyspora alba]PSL04001.1 hypothetical protein CLV30_1063 [Haloactinopolyspora alba]